MLPFFHKKPKRQSVEENVQYNLFKILMEGLDNVGKTSFVNCYRQEWDAITIDEDLASKIVVVGNDVFKLHVWDFDSNKMGNSQFYRRYRGANGILLLYDVTSKKTFEIINHILHGTFYNNKINNQHAMQT